MNETRRAVRVLAWGMVLLPALLLLLYIVLHRVNGPTWDYTTLAEVFDKWHHGTFTLSFLFRQHNEHRIAVPRLVILALGELTRWDNRTEMIAHWWLMCAITVLLFRSFRIELGGGVTSTERLLLFVPIALLSLSPRSQQAFMGFGFPHYLMILFFLAALNLLTFRRRSVATVAAAIVCAVAACFSLSNGLLVWPIGLGVLLSELHVRSRPRGPVAAIAAWIACGAIVYAAYFHGYVDPGNHSSPSFVLQHPRLAGEHFMVLNGSVFATDVANALAFGTLAFTFYLAVVLAAAVDWWRHREPVPFGAWLVVTVLGSETMITLNRSGLLPVQGLDSRYTALLALGPIGLYAALVVRRTRWRFAVQSAIAVGALVAVGYLSVSIATWATAPIEMSDRKRMSYLVYSAKYQPDSILERLYANPQHARIYSAELEQLGLNVFADPHIRPDALVPTAVRPRFTVEKINGRAPGAEPIVMGAEDAIRLTGRAYDDAGTGPARGVFLTIDGARDLPAAAGLYTPPDIGYVSHRAYDWAGFDGSFGGSVLPPGDHTLALKIVADDGLHAYLSPTIARIKRR